MAFLCKGLIPIIVILAALAACAPEDRPLEAATGGGELVARGGPGSEYGGHFTVPANQTVQLLGQHADCRWLQIGVADQGEAWIEAQWLALPDEFDCAGLPAGTYQPQTGVLMRPSGRTGLGELTIENGSTFDGIAILTTADDQPVVSAFIRDGDTFKIDRIPDGSYLLYFSGGEGWNGRVFSERASFQRFDELFPFFTSDRSYSIWSVTLHPVVDGDAQAEDVDPDQFPAIGQ